MVKKIVLGLLIAGLSTGLILGAVKRTQAKTEQSEAGPAEAGRVEREVGSLRDSRGTNGGGGRGWETREAANLAQASPGNSGQSGQGGRRGGEGEARSNLREESANTAAEITELITKEGVVLQTSGESLILILPSGEQVILEGRAWRFALESGFSTGLGHQIELNGFYEDGEFKPARLVDLTSSASITLREEAGKPLWAGGYGRGT